MGDKAAAAQQQHSSGKQKRNTGTQSLKSKNPCSYRYLGNDLSTSTLEESMLKPWQSPVAKPVAVLRNVSGALPASINKRTRHMPAQQPAHTNYYDFGSLPSVADLFHLQFLQILLTGRSDLVHRASTSARPGSGQHQTILKSVLLVRGSNGGFNKRNLRKGTQDLHRYMNYPVTIPPL